MSFYIAYGNIPSVMVAPWQWPLFWCRFLVRKSSLYDEFVTNEFMLKKVVYINTMFFDTDRKRKGNLTEEKLKLISNTTKLFNHLINNKLKSKLMNKQKKSYR